MRVPIWGPSHKTSSLGASRRKICFCRLSRPMIVRNHHAYGSELGDWEYILAERRNICANASHVFDRASNAALPTATHGGRQGPQTVTLPCHDTFISDFGVKGVQWAISI